MSSTTSLFITVQTCRLRVLRALLSSTAFIACVYLIGCSSMVEPVPKRDTTVPHTKAQTDYLERSKTLFAEGKYEAALQENQKALVEGTGAPDAALFNLGLISAYSQNPKKDYPKALQSFKALVAQYPGSPYTEQGKVWIHVLEEHQKLADERQKLVEEKRTLMREREVLSQERERLKYTAEKTRQLDMDIEKRRRRSLKR